MTISADPAETALLHISREERETHLLRNDSGDGWDFHTLSPVWKRRLEKLGYTPQTDHQMGWSVQLPDNAITFRREASTRREMSPERKAGLAAALKRSKQPK